MENDTDSGQQEESVIGGDDNKMDLQYFEDFCTGTSGVKLYQWRYEPTKTAPSRLLFITHGLNEHSKRYDKLARLLCSELNCVVLSHDHVGHGKSEGERVMVDTFETFVHDVFNNIDNVKKLYPELPVYLFGHSMGGEIALVAACERPEYFQGVVLSAPAIIVDPAIEPGRILKFLAKVLTRVCPSMEAIPPFDINEISSNKEEVQIYNDDPLTWHGGVKVRTTKVIGDKMLEIQQLLISKIQWPFLVIHGEEDKITHIGGSELLFKNAQSRDRALKIYKGLKHDLLHEVPEQAEQVASDILEWFRTRMQSPSTG